MDAEQFGTTDRTRAREVSEPFAPSCRTDTGGGTGPSARPPLVPLATHPPRDAHRECEKLGVIEALLAKERYESVLEIGCGHGALARRLGARCGSYCGMEADLAMLAQARGSVGGSRFVPLTTPFRLPSGAHELVLLSEVLHLFDAIDSLALGKALEARAACREIIVVSPCEEGDRSDRDRREAAFERFADTLAARFEAVELAARRRYRVDALMVRESAVEG